jgi:hypothetical protein
LNVLLDWFSLATDAPLDMEFADWHASAKGPSLQLHLSLLLGYSPHLSAMKKVFSANIYVQAVTLFLTLFPIQTLLVLDT